MLFDWRAHPYLVVSSGFLTSQLSQKSDLVFFLAEGHLMSPNSYLVSRVGIKWQTRLANA